MKKNDNGPIEILIAEDSPTQAELLKMLLEESHYLVATAVNGKDALAQIGKRQPALVISDIIMPELDGYGLCKAIKSDEKLKHIPVMLVTTLSDPDDVIRGLECGADNFIRKPYEAKYLLSRIKYLLMNVELRKNQRMQMALEIDIGGKKHFITAERQQILDLLVSTYEQAVQVNGELKQRERELAHSNQILQGLNRIAEGLNSVVSERDVAETALRHALELPGIQAGWISLRTGETSFRLAAACGLPPALSGPDAFEGNCACRHQLLNGELSAGNNIIQCERLAKAKGDTQGLCCHASIPLWLGDGRALGVMNLAGHGNKLFSEDELKILYSVGNQVAVALERARLHENLEMLVAERTAKLTAEIEERKRIEQEQVRLVAIIEATPDFVGTADLDGHPIFTNRAGLRMLGFDPEQGVPAVNIVETHPEWAAKRVLEEGIPYAIEHGSWSGETALLRRDGTEIPVSQVIIAHKGADGAVELLSTIMRDITERKRDEDALKRSQVLLNETGRLATVSGWELHTDTWELQWTDELYRFYEVDRTFKPTLGSVLDFHVPWSKPLREQAVQRAIEHGEPFDLELEVITAKGNHRWIHSIGRPDLEHRKIYGALVDITERKQAEMALLRLNESLEQRVAERTTDLERARREADDANRTKSAFLSTMSHEIRTPMNGVVGMVDVLAQSRLSEHQADLVKTIRESANILLDIIDDILDFSKIEAGRMELDRVPVSVADLVEGLCNSLVSVATHKGVELSLFISPDIPERILSDDVRLRQVLYNLVGNAIKFSAGRPGKQGKVSIRVTIADAAPLRLALRIADNGIGMAPETMSYLFTPFTQAEISTTRRFGGTGLGLSICKRLVDMMQGEIAVESTLGEGTTFTVTLPFELAPEQPVSSLPDLSGLECIVLESPEINAGDLRVYLEHVGAKVHLAADAATAVRIAAQITAPVVVILLAEHGNVPVALHAPLSAVPDMRYLLITHGRRRRSRVEGPNLVSMDGAALRRLALLRAVAVAAGRASPEIFHDRPEELLASEAAPPTIAEARAQGRLILIAEDDDINQKVILRQLALLGYAAEIAANGVEALRLWRDGRYALLLTDLHMPEMDGYTLAETIRSEEAGRSHVPIVALTANALRGEANRVHASGMDDYLTKPVQLQLLRDTLEKWLPGAGENKAPDMRMEPSGEPAAATAVDVGLLQGLVGNDRTTVHEFLADYLASARHLAGEMRAALTAGDTRHVSAIAHKLKSSSRSVGAMALGDLCAELENSGKTGDKAAIAQGMAQFETALAQVEAEITVLLREQ